MQAEQSMHQIHLIDPEPDLVRPSTPSLLNDQYPIIIPQIGGRPKNVNEFQSVLSTAPILNVNQPFIPSLTLKEETQNNDPYVLVPLSMLRLGRTNVRTSSSKAIMHPHIPCNSCGETNCNKVSSPNHRKLIPEAQESNLHQLRKSLQSNTSPYKESRKVIKKKTHSKTNKNLKKNLKEATKPIKIDERVKENEENNSTLCKVCGDTATKYIHYGGRSCASCRAFFRRSAESAKRYIQKIMTF